MAHPKRRHSNSRTGTRRAHDAAIPKSVSKCPHCGVYVLPHRVCGKCGYYRGRQVITFKVKEDKNKKG